MTATVLDPRPLPVDTQPPVSLLVAAAVVLIILVLVVVASPFITWPVAGITLGVLAGWVRHGHRGER